MNYFYIIISILVVLLVVFLYIINNLLKKVEKYEDVIEFQSTYVELISKEVKDGKKHLEELDTKGHFRADDELGIFFEKMKEIQFNLDKFILPDNYFQK